MATNTAPLVLAGTIAVLAILALLVVYLRAHKRGAIAVQPHPPDAMQDGAAAASSAAAWRPPVQPDPPPPPAAGPSLATGIVLIRSEASGLEVIWNALVDGTQPVAVQWGAPEIRLSGDVLELSYVCEAGQTAGADFQTPRTRVYKPGEIVSRAVQVRWPLLGRSPAGLKVLVAVGYGPADGLAQAASSREAYLAWQRVAAARARPVPAAT